MTDAEKLQILFDISGHDEWDVERDEDGEIDEASCAGEDADGVPEWNVSVLCGEVILKRTVGWYTQIADATWETAIVMARSLDAADAALEQFWADHHRSQTPQ